MCAFLLSKKGGDLPLMLTRYATRNGVSQYCMLNYSVSFSFLLNRQIRLFTENWHGLVHENKESSILQTAIFGVLPIM